MTVAKGKSESGFTLVALMIGIAILTILIAGVAPSVGAIMKRDREEELIFRGKQYARAIGLFQRRYGRYPNELKELYENRPRTIRKLWKDPMCNCAFQVFGMVDVPPGIPGAPAPSSSQFPPGPTPHPTAAPTPGAFGPTSGETKTVGPIVGVRSSVHKEALREWRGQKYYDQWKFQVGDADRDLIVQLPGQGALPGQPVFPTPSSKF
jgi:type II secretory pathway pseudopilin PulG